MDDRVSRLSLKPIQLCDFTISFEMTESRPVPKIITGEYKRKVKAPEIVHVMRKFRRCIHLVRHGSLDKMYVATTQREMPAMG